VATWMLLKGVGTYIHNIVFGFLTIEVVGGAWQAGKNTPLR